MKTFRFALLLMASSLVLAEEEAGPSNRIDFGNSYVQGQSIKSGAVYLMNRKKNEIQSMLQKRESYRDDILAAYPEFYDAEAGEDTTDSTGVSAGANAAVSATPTVKPKL